MGLRAGEYEQVAGHRIGFELGIGFDCGLCEARHINHGTVFSPN
jgi:hypothetical protein